MSAPDEPAWPGLLGVLLVGPPATCLWVGAAAFALRGELDPGDGPQALAFGLGGLAIDLLCLAAFWRRRHARGLTGALVWATPVVLLLSGDLGYWLASRISAERVAGEVDMAGWLCREQAPADPACPARALACVKASRAVPFGAREQAQRDCLAGR